MWLPESAELAGQQIPMPATRWRISGANYVVVSAESRDAGLLVFGAEGSAATVDLIGTSGPNAGRTIPAIWRLEGDVLELCYDVGGGPRPTRFSGTAGETWLRVRYRCEG